MVICICKRITDKQIQQAIADGANSLVDLQKKLGVSTRCGKCANFTKSLLSDYATAQALDGSQFIQAQNL